MPKISVAMGIFNVEETLGEALDSLLNQTYQDFDIVLCDDGSSDKSLQIAKEYQNRFPNRIIVLQNEKNMGLNYTLNHCLEHCSGEYVARMDGDDLCDETRFEKQVAFLDFHPEYAFVSSPMKYFDENGYWGESHEIECPVAMDFIYGIPFSHAPVMVRKEVYDAVGGYSVDEKLLRVEDYNLYMKMYAKGYKGYNLQEPLYSMRDGRDAISRRKFKFRLNEAYAKRLAVKELGLPKWAYIYSFRPIIVGLLPLPIYKFLHKKRMSK